MSNLVRSVRNGYQLLDVKWTNIRMRWSGWFHFKLQFMGGYMIKSDRWFKNTSHTSHMITCHYVICLWTSHKFSILIYQTLWFSLANWGLWVLIVTPRVIASFFGAVLRCFMRATQIKPMKKTCWKRHLRELLLDRADLENNRRFGDLRRVQWHIDLKILPSFSSSINDLHRVTTSSHRRYWLCLDICLWLSHANKFV